MFPSPFEAFDAYDRRRRARHRAPCARSSGRSSETGAWAALERGELTMDEFFAALEAEATAAGFELDARAAHGS